ncbi:MAG: hypothetical protein BRD51_02705 [Bacteroidetes bacterium SW_11_64_17]|nr:MAG: hypothetical protein BRD51_02705 [Bacteroidetes bacterium SW_11_64_17]
MSPLEGAELHVGARIRGRRAGAEDGAEGLGILDRLGGRGIVLHIVVHPEVACRLGGEQLFAPHVRAPAVERSRPVAFSADCENRNGLRGRRTLLVGAEIGIDVGNKRGNACVAPRMLNRETVGHLSPSETPYTQTRSGLTAARSVIQSVRRTRKPASSGVPPTSGRGVQSFQTTPVCWVALGTTSRTLSSSATVVHSEEGAFPVPGNIASMPMVAPWRAITTAASSGRAVGT